MLTHTFSPLAQSDTKGETLKQSHVYPCGADSIGKQESRQAKWSHTLVSSAVALNFLGATLHNYRKGSRPLQLTLKESVRLQVSAGLITCKTALRDEREEERAESDDTLMENQDLGMAKLEKMSPST